MNLIDNFKEKAKKNPKTIAYPEGEQERIIKAADVVLRENIAYPILLGDEEKITEKAAEIGIELEGIKISEPAKSPKIPEYADIYRQSRDVKDRVAQRMMKRPLYFAPMMVRAGDADGVVGGCTFTTAAVVMAGQLTIGLAEGFATPSSFFIMALPEGSPYGEDGVLIYADAGVNPDPTVEELADIAITTANSARTLLGWEPRVAMLSYSTKGSADHALVKKVIEATKIAEEKAPGILIDGELQVDSAIVPEVAERKGGNKLEGKANILIFPNLDAGNIAYKLTQYLANAEAYGPILQGFAKPICDLSRGASVEDIVGVTAITVVEAQ